MAKARIAYVSAMRKVRVAESAYVEQVKSWTGETPVTTEQAETRTLENAIYNYITALQEFESEVLANVRTNIEELVATFQPALADLGTVVKATNLVAQLAGLRNWVSAINKGQSAGAKVSADFGPST
jgi:hypothetical protein